MYTLSERLAAGGMSAEMRSLEGTSDRNQQAASLGLCALLGRITERIVVLRRVLVSPTRQRVLVRLLLQRPF